MVDSNVLQIAKSMKRTYVELCSNYICGLDESMSLFSIVFAGSNEYYFGKINTLVKETEVDGRKYLYFVILIFLILKIWLLVKYILEYKKRDV